MFAYAVEDIKKEEAGFKDVITLMFTSSSACNWNYTGNVYLYSSIY